MSARETKPPSLSDFYRDMNEHQNATYRKIGDSYVAELDSCPGGWQLTLWKAVEHPTQEGYREPDGKPENQYAWDAVGREGFDDLEDGEERLKELGNSVNDAREWASEHPYEGPRRSYAERMADREG